MSAVLYDVVISGYTLNNISVADASANLGKLFKIDAKKAALLLQQQERVVRKAVDLATAQKWQRALQNAGVETLYVPSEEEAANSASEPTKPAASTSEVNVVGTIRVAGEGFTGKFTVAPVGAQVGEPALPVPQITTTQLANVGLAPAGADIDTLADNREPVIVDISHLTLEE